jgi:hypothetical protein
MKKIIIGLLLALSAAAFSQTCPPAYASGTSYSKGDVVTGSDGNQYQAIASVPALGSFTNPVSDPNVYWELDKVVGAQNLVLNVDPYPSSGFRIFTTIPAVMTYIQDAVIGTGATITIQVADSTSGPYAYTAPVALNHAFGSQIQLIGDTANPSACVLSFSGSSNPSGLVVNPGHTLGLIDGFTINGPSSSDGLYDAGISAYGSTVTVGGHIAINDFNYGIEARTGTAILLNNNSGYGPTVSNCAYGYLSLYGGKMTMTNATANSCTYGFAAASESFMLGAGCLGTSDTDGFYIHNASTIVGPGASGSLSVYIPTGAPGYGSYFFTGY